MGWCSDPAAAYLSNYSYNVIMFPKADVRPLQILAKQGHRLDRLGELATILVQGKNIQLPQVGADTLSAGISGQRTSDLSIGVGLSILGAVIGAMGGSKLGLDGTYQQAETIAFEFDEVFENSVEVAKLDQYLGDADVSPFSRHVADLLESDEVYVITAAIKSKKFTVEAKKSDGLALGLSVPAIQKVVSGNVKVSGQSQTSSKISYEGPRFLVFGFQAVQLFYENGKYTAFEPLKPGGGTMGLQSAPQDSPKHLKLERPMLRLRGDLE